MLDLLWKCKVIYTDTTAYFFLWQNRRNCSLELQQFFFHLRPVHWFFNHNCEFITADSSYCSSFVKRLLKILYYLAQRLIPCHMSQGIIDLLKPVHIQKQELNLQIHNVIVQHR